MPEPGWWMGWAGHNEWLCGSTLNIGTPSGEVDIGRCVELGKVSLKTLGILP